MRPLLIALAITLAAPLALAQNADNPLSKDKTGLRWALPFKTALAQSKTEKRLLLIKPVAFGTKPDGGW